MENLHISERGGEEIALRTRGMIDALVPGPEPLRFPREGVDYRVDHLLWKIEVKRGQNYLAALEMYPHLYREVAKYLPVGDIIKLVSLNKHLQAFFKFGSSDLFYIAAHQCPEASRIYLPRFYKDVCPLGVNDKSGKGFKALTGEINGGLYAPQATFAWLGSLKKRENCINEVLTCLEGAGFSIPVGMAKSVHKVWLVLDCEAKLRWSLMDESEWMLDEDLRNLQIFILQLDAYLIAPTTSKQRNLNRHDLFGCHTLFSIRNSIKKMAESESGSLRIADYQTAVRNHLLKFGLAPREREEIAPVNSEMPRIDELVHTEVIWRGVDFTHYVEKNVMKGSDFRYDAGNGNTTSGGETGLHQADLDGSRDTNLMNNAESPASENYDVGTYNTWNANAYEEGGDEICQEWNDSTLSDDDEDENDLEREISSTFVREENAVETIIGHQQHILSTTSNNSSSAATAGVSIQRQQFSPTPSDTSGRGLASISEETEEDLAAALDSVFEEFSKLIMTPPARSGATSLSITSNDEVHPNTLGFNADDKSPSLRTQLSSSTDNSTSGDKTSKIATTNLYVSLADAPFSPHGDRGPTTAIKHKPRVDHLSTKQDEASSEKFFDADAYEADDLELPVIDTESTDSSSNSYTGSANFSGFSFSYEDKAPGSSPLNSLAYANFPCFDYTEGTEGTDAQEETPKKVEDSEIYELDASPTPRAPQQHNRLTFGYGHDTGDTSVTPYDSSPSYAAKSEYAYHKAGNENTTPASYAQTPHYPAKPESARFAGIPDTSLTGYETPYYSTKLQSAAFRAGTQDTSLAGYDYYPSTLAGPASAAPQANTENTTLAGFNNSPSYSIEANLSANIYAANQETTALAGYSTHPYSAGPQASSVAPPPSTADTALAAYNHSPSYSINRPAGLYVKPAQQLPPTTPAPPTTQASQAHYSHATTPARAYTHTPAPAAPTTPQTTPQAYGNDDPFYPYDPPTERKIRPGEKVFSMDDFVPKVEAISHAAPPQTGLKHKISQVLKKPKWI